MNRTSFPLLAALLACLVLPNEVFGQLVRNTNLSRRSGSTITGGSGNLISSNTTNAFIAGGENNKIGTNATWSTIAGGVDNTVDGEFAAVAGGYTNTVKGPGAAVLGGTFNKAASYGAVVGGQFNEAQTNSFAGGEYAKATNKGCFVWAGTADPDVTTVSTNDYSFTVRASGGARFITSPTATNFSSATPILGVFLARNTTTWAALSDSNAKTDIAAVEPRSILRKLAALPVTRWKYKGFPDRSYIGPMAQDFHAAFGLGADDKTISTLDSDGVMYAAIQGLVEEIKLRDAKIARLEARSLEQRAESKDEIEDLKTELRAISEQLSKLPPR